MNEISDEYSEHKQKGGRHRPEARKRSSSRSDRSRARDLQLPATSLATSAEVGVAPSASYKEGSGQAEYGDRRKQPVADEPSSDVLVSELLSELKVEADARRMKHEKSTAPPKDTGLRPFPTFRGPPPRPVDLLEVPPGKTTADAAGEGTSKPKVWKAKTSPVESGLGAQVENRVLLDQPIGSMDRLKETQSRKPWGGAARERASSPPPKATFDTLAKADRTTPKEHIEISVSKRPFGIMDSLKKLWRGSPEGPMEGLRSRPLTEKEPDESSTAQPTSVASAAGTTEDNVSDNVELVHPLSADAASPSNFQSSEPGIAPPPEAHEAALSSLTKLYTKGSPLSDESRNTTSRAEGEVTEHSQADPKAEPPQNGTLAQGTDSHESRPIQKLKLEPAQLRLEQLEAEKLKLQPLAATQDTAPSRAKRRRLSRRDRNATRELGKSPTPHLSSSEEHDNRSELAGTTAHSFADQVSGLSLRDAMNGGAKSEATRARPVFRKVPQRKAHVEAPAAVQQAAEEVNPVVEEVNPVVEPESVSEVGEVGVEVEEQARVDLQSVQLTDLEVKQLELPQPPVPFLEYGLDRVLFNPGIYQLQDAASRVYNFDPYLQKIMPVEQFDFNSLKEYKTSSQDTALAEIAKQEGTRYVGSTSSMTSSLAHFHYLISNWRPLNLNMLSHGYFGPNTRSQYTKITKAPSAIFLRWKNGSYAIDADKEYDSPNVLMLLGKSMELLLTLPKDEYEKYRKSDPREVSEVQRTAPESYQYSTMGDFLMRSQLDAYDPRLPGNGTFDLKTRAVVSIRMSARDHEKMTGYEIYGDHGRWCSYEKEYHDMARATMLKYMLQARMGRMNGIFVAYHNVKRIFGFQYIPISEMDKLLHGQTDPSLGDQEFKASLRIMNDLLNKATAQYPEQSLRIHFETQESRGDDDSPTHLHMFAEPMTEEEIDGIQNKNKERTAEYERTVMGKETSSATNAKEKAEGEGEKAASDESAATGNDQDDASAYARQRLSSSDAPADQPFLEQVKTLQTSELRPLFYATVIVQSQVNGAIPGEDRPKNLKADDQWELNYLIKDYDVTSHIWSLYSDMKARRREALWFEEDEGEVGEGLDGEGNLTPKVAKQDGYLQFLERLSKEGDMLREKIDLADRESGKDKDIVRVDDPLPSVRESISSVEDYMSWMYRREQRE